MNAEERDRLFAEALGGEITDQDRERLNAWLAASDEDRADFESARRVCEQLGRLSPTDTDADVFACAPAPRMSVFARRRRMGLVGALTRYAAAVALGFLGGFLAQGGPGTPTVLPRGTAEHGEQRVASPADRPTRTLGDYRSRYAVAPDLATGMAVVLGGRR